MRQLPLIENPDLAHLSDVFQHSCDAAILLCQRQDHW